MIMKYFVLLANAQNCQRHEGFAINGGKGWADVVFDNHFINVIGEVAIAMGNYYFTSCADGSKTKVEYTFGYAKNSDGKAGALKLRVYLLGVLGDLGIAWG